VALLAAVGTGAFKSIVEACQATIKIESSTTPNSKTRRTYDASYPLYQKLYRSLKDDFRIISELVSGR
jgi:xylulokinase